METVHEESIHLSQEGPNEVDFPIDVSTADAELIETTHRHLNQITKGSKLFEKLSPVPSLNPNEIHLGEVLGEGAFGMVCLVESINMLSNGNESISTLMQTAASSTAHKSFSRINMLDLSNSPGHHLSYDFHQSDEYKNEPSEKSNTISLLPFSSSANTFDISFLSLPEFTESTCDEEIDEMFDDDNDDNHDKADDTPRQLSWANLAASTRRDGQPRYALKALKPDISKSKRLMATIDLACEALFLRALHHTNIVQLRATVGIPGSPDYGLFLDRLTCTLQDKIKSWAEEHRTYSELYGSKCSCKQPQTDMMFFRERLVICLDIARALCHIHHHSVVYRDLKPDNIGFNVRGHVQIFDFGLAKEFNPRDKVAVADDNIYRNSTGLTGSRRYMAPEVTLCKPYGLIVDVYAYGLVF